MIITIERECGCDADLIGEKLADKYAIPLYDRKKITQIAKDKGIYGRIPNFFEENPVNSLLYAIAEGMGDYKLYNVPKDVLNETIDADSFILIGHCGNYAFKGKKDAYRFFLCRDKEKRIGRIMETNNLSRTGAKELIDEIDNKRSSFQKYYTNQIWKEACNYDMCLDITRLGIDGAVRIIHEYITLERANQNL